MARSKGGGRGGASTADSAPPRRQRQPPTVSERKRRVARRQPHDAELLHEQPHAHVDAPEDVVGDQDPHIADEALEDVAGGDQGIAGDQTRFPGGPYDGSLLTDFQHHVAYQIWQGERDALKVASHGMELQKWLKGRVPLPPQVHDHLSEAGLTSLLYCSFRMVDRALASAFAERWHREKSSFHLLFGEMTVTLDNVSVLLGLKVRGSFYVALVMDPDIACLTLFTDITGVYI